LGGRAVTTWLPASKVAGRVLRPTGVRAAEVRPKRLPTEWGPTASHAQRLGCQLRSLRTRRVLHRRMEIPLRALGPSLVRPSHLRDCQPRCGYLHPILRPSYLTPAARRISISATERE